MSTGSFFLQQMQMIDQGTKAPGIYS